MVRYACGYVCALQHSIIFGSLQDPWRKATNAQHNGTWHRKYYKKGLRMRHQNLFFSVLGTKEALDRLCDLKLDLLAGAYVAFSVTPFLCLL